MLSANFKPKRTARLSYLKTFARTHLLQGKLCGCHCAKKPLRAADCVEQNATEPAAISLRYSSDDKSSRRGDIGRGRREVAETSPASAHALNSVANVPSSCGHISQVRCDRSSALATLR